MKLAAFSRGGGTAVSAVDIAAARSSILPITAAISSSKCIQLELEIEKIGGLRNRMLKSEHRRSTLAKA